MRTVARLALAIGLMMPLGSLASHAQSFSDGQRGEIEKIIHQYLVEHPE
ncbi:MAG: DsbA family protein, partial [Rhizobiales bacterium]|nr:DsbA family protein [Hyphomicrobiales bacterium]